MYLSIRLVHIMYPLTIEGVSWSRLWKIEQGRQKKKAHLHVASWIIADTCPNVEELKEGIDGSSTQMPAA